MSRRVNLYGWSFEGFVKMLGSKNAAVLEAATARLAEAFDDEALRARGNAWIRTLIEAGFPLAKDRAPPAEPADGGLLTMHMETEAHVVAVHSIVRAIAHDDYLDLTSESTDLNHGALTGLLHEMKSCGFTHSEFGLKHCDDGYWTRWVKLLDGTPFFGDDFRTWSFYSWWSNHDLAGMIPVLQAAAEFQRPFPSSFAQAPEENREYLRRNYKTSLSEGGKAGATALIKWFTQIQQAGQDAFILWC